ncbi:MAG: ferric reductase-like transmembrane domain-containing protein, partial [Solirubrobacteraceae bacterium]
MLAAAAVSSSPRVLWYLTRGTGVVTLILLTLTVALGVANRKRIETVRVPRFVIDAVHRNASLLAVTFVFIHVVTTLLDSYVSVSVVSVILPFTASYKPFWLGLGAVAFDLLMAVTLTSILRRRLGHRAWRTTHWLAYASWPV